VRLRVGLAVFAVALAGCGMIFGGAAPDLEPVPVGPFGPVVAAPDGVGPPIECRRIARDRCLEVGVIHDGVGVNVDEVDRVIVSCIGRCTSESGEFRIDFLQGNFTTEHARGGYGTSQ
jgi:hypothetical protein